MNNADFNKNYSTIRKWWWWWCLNFISQFSIKLFSSSCFSSSASAFQCIAFFRYFQTNSFFLFSHFVGGYFFFLRIFLIFSTKFSYVRMYVYQKSSIWLHTYKVWDENSSSRVVVASSRSRRRRYRCFSRLLRLCIAIISCKLLEEMLGSCILLWCCRVEWAE